MYWQILTFSYLVPREEDQPERSGNVCLYSLWRLTGTDCAGEAKYHCKATSKRPAVQEASMEMATAIKLSPRFLGYSDCCCACHCPLLQSAKGLFCY